MRILLALFWMSVFVCYSCFAQDKPTDVPPQQISLDDALSDANYLAEFLETVHPDPYTSFGGKVEFKRRVKRLVENIPAGDISVPEFRKLLAAFLAELGDGHTYIERLGGSNSNPTSYLPVQFAIHSGGIHVADVLDAHRSLLGCKVVAVQGINVDRLAAEIQSVFPRENMPGRLSLLSRYLPSRNSLSVLLPGLGESITLTLQHLDGKTSDTVLPFNLSRTERDLATWIQGVGSFAEFGKGLFHGSLIDNSTVGYFRMNTVWSREAFELMHASGRTDTKEWLERTYERYVLKEMPADLNVAIRDMPSLVEETKQLLTLMNQKKVSRLIVDLRGNDGGWSEILRFFLFLLYGDKFLTTGSPVSYVTVVSEGKLKINGMTLEELSAEVGRKLQLGDYIFEPATGAQSRQEFIDQMSKAGVTGLDALKQYRPPESVQVVVITDGRTFSAAFDLTYDLWRFGAKTLGVSPSQAPVSYVDGTPYQLPHSRLSGAVSRTSVIHPNIPTAERAIVLDYPMSWQDFREFQFDPDAPVKYALRLFRGGN